MTKGIIYICTTSVDGLIKIGRTDNFNARLNILEQNGYWNVSGLKRFYAVRVDDYIEKEKLIHTIFSKSQVANSELFALDKNLAKNQMASFDKKWHYGFNSLFQIFLRIPLFWIFIPVMYILKITSLGSFIYNELALKRKIIPLHCDSESCEI